MSLQYLTQTILISSELSVVLLIAIISFKLSSSIYKYDFLFLKWAWAVNVAYILCFLISRYVSSNPFILKVGTIGFAPSYLTIAEDFFDLGQTVLFYLAIINTEYTFPLANLFRKRKYVFPCIGLILLLFIVIGRYFVFPPTLSPLINEILLILKCVYNFLALFCIAFFLRSLVKRYKATKNVLFIGTLVYAIIQLFPLIGSEVIKHYVIIPWFLGLNAKFLIFWGLVQIFNLAAKRSANLESQISYTFHDILNNLVSAQSNTIRIQDSPTTSISAKNEADAISDAHEIIASIIDAAITTTNEQFLFFNSENHIEIDLRSLAHSTKEKMKVNTLIEMSKIAIKNIAGNGLRVYCDYGGRCNIEGFKHEILQVLLNLFKNSYESFKNGEGRIKVITRNKYYDNENIEIKQVNVVIEDDGPGIPIEIQNKVFNHGYSTKGTVGRGLGLSIVKMLIEKKYGSVKMESPIFSSGDKKYGTRFTIIFN